MLCAAGRRIAAESSDVLELRNNCRACGVRHGPLLSGPVDPKRLLPGEGDIMYVRTYRGGSQNVSNVFKVYGTVGIRKCPLVELPIERLSVVMPPSSTSVKCRLFVVLPTPMSPSDVL